MPCLTSPLCLGPSLMAMLSPLTDRLWFFLRPLKAAISAMHPEQQVPPQFRKSTFPIASLSMLLLPQIYQRKLRRCLISFLQFIR